MINEKELQEQYVQYVKSIENLLARQKNIQNEVMNLPSIPNKNILKKQHEEINKNLENAIRLYKETIIPNLRKREYDNGS